MYHDIKERHEILIKNIDNVHNDELYMPRSEVINVVETLFCEDFQNRITKIVDKKLNVTLNKISNESKIVSTNVSELITQVSNASQKVSDVFVKIDNLYDKCDEVTDIFLEKGKIHLQLIQKQTYCHDKIFQDKMKKFKTELDTIVNTKLNKRIKSLSKQDLSQLNKPKTNISKTNIDKLIISIDEFENMIESSNKKTISPIISNTINDKKKNKKT